MTTTQNHKIDRKLHGKVLVEVARLKSKGEKASVKDFIEDAIKAKLKSK